MSETRERTGGSAASRLDGWFERAVIGVLSALLIIVILAGMWALIRDIIFDLMLNGPFDPTQHSDLHSVFGAILTVIIALEFKRSIVVSIESHETVIHVRTVVLVALLALLRKFIVLDLAETGAGTIAALAFATLALGGIYWIVHLRAPGGATRATTR